MRSTALLARQISAHLYHAHREYNLQLHPTRAAFLTFSTVFWYYDDWVATMNRKHQRTLAAVFKIPIQSNIAWQDCERLLEALGADISEGAGSRVRIVLRGVKAVFHRPHPHKEIDKGALISLRKFLIHAGVQMDRESSHDEV